MSSILKGIFPLLWMSECCKYFLVPVGENDYRDFRKIQEFVQKGLPISNGVKSAKWTEYDISRIVSNVGGK